MVTGEERRSNYRSDQDCGFTSRIMGQSRTQQLEHLLLQVRYDRRLGGFKFEELPFLCRYAILWPEMAPGVD
jgi:hypothetical protein